ncbi:hypothetical protein [Paenibacillus dauci]|uniref:hypothetical protein n=1 Tax=Paenibacillus dauci TaxID=1567106 RepID=UPI00061955EA|nr:hypothetical protein [Paenibacillus dauci]
MKFGINNYEPNFYKSSSEIIQSFSSQLLRLKEQHIINIYAMWDKINEEWNDDAPIILEFTAFNLEVCNYKLEELALSINLINIHQEIEKYDFEEFGKFEYEWRKRPEEVLKFNRATIISMEIIEYKFESTLIASQSVTEEIGQTTSNWILNGIGFITSKGYFSICNGLDTNRISHFREEGDYLRYIKVF